MYTIYRSPLGSIILSEKNGCLNGCWFADQPDAPNAEILKIDTEPSPVLELAGIWLDAYFSGKSSALNLPPLCPEGTDFQMEVWNQLRDIAEGQVVSYGELAAGLAEKRGRNVSARAVGHALGLNPISIFLPCHRVIGKDQKLTGYAGGLNRKEQLLILEGHEVRDGKLIR